MGGLPRSRVWNSLPKAELVGIISMMSPRTTRSKWQDPIPAVKAAPTTSWKLQNLPDDPAQASVTDEHRGRRGIPTNSRNRATAPQHKYRTLKFERLFIELARSQAMCEV
jgi:hypothetical protein